MLVQSQLEADGKATVEVAGSTHTLTADMVTIERKTKKVHGRNYTPSVIEPSFGIGRILYCIFEHTFYTRPDDAQKTVFKFAPMIAPIKVTVFPLMQNEELNDVANAISLRLRRAGVSSIIDTTGPPLLHFAFKSSEFCCSPRRRHVYLMLAARRSEPPPCRCDHRQALCANR